LFLLLGHSEDDLIVLFLKLPLPAATAVFPYIAIISYKVVSTITMFRGVKVRKHTYLEDWCYVLKDPKVFRNADGTIIKRGKIFTSGRCRGSIGRDPKRLTLLDNNRAFHIRVIRIHKFIGASRFTKRVPEIRAVHHLR
jgi:hypothetical protein